MQIKRMRFFVSLIFAVCFSVSLASADSAFRIEGVKLYEGKCASCHGKLDNTDVPNRPKARIVSAIRYFAVMNNLKNLSDNEIEAIAETLKIN